MKKTLIMFVLFLALGIGTFAFLNQQTEEITTVAGNDRAFAVEDPNDIHKIFIADRNGKETTIERNGEEWKVNGKYKARDNAMKNLMNVLTKVQIKNIPPNAAIPSVVKTLAGHGIKVEIYNKANDRIRTYYVGGMTNTEKGTYMIVEGSEQPYVMHIPSMEGGLRVRFTMTEDEWRDRVVFNTLPEDVDFVSIEYPKQKSKSFKLKRNGGDFEITPFYELTKEITKPYKNGSGESFLIGMQNIQAEAFQNLYPSRDSISQLLPFCIMTIKDKKGETEEFRFHPIRTLDAGGNPITDDQVFEDTSIERYHLNCSSGDFMLVQHRLFGKVFWSYDSFFKK